MIFAFVIVLVAGLIGLYEVPKMIKQNMKKELIVFGSLLGIATILSVLIAMGIQVPNPLQALIFILGPIGEFIVSLFGSNVG